MSRERKKPNSGWRQVAVGAVVLLVIAVGTVWYKRYSAEQSMREPLARRDQPPPEKSVFKPRPVSNVADRPSRDRGPRP
jgi:uncharacterized membrane protein YebE (DUF533 family)